MQTPTPIILEDLPISFFENGPIREILEIQFDTVLDRLIRERQMQLIQDSVRYIHDGVIPGIFYEIMEQSKNVHKDGNAYAISPAGQKLMCKLLERKISPFLDAMISEGSLDVHEFFLHPVFGCFRALPAKVKKFLTNG